MNCDLCGEPIRDGQDYRQGPYLTVHTFCQVLGEARAAQRVAESLERRLND